MIAHAGKNVNEELNTLATSLDELSAVVLRSWGEDRTLREAFGWHHPALTRQDLARIPASLASRIREANVNGLDKEIESKIIDFPRRFQLIHSETIPFMFNGNGHQAVPAYMETLNGLKSILEPLFGWQTLQDTKAMPVQLAKRLRSLQVEIEAIVPNKEAIEQQIRLIHEATEAAESLPADLQSLKEARNTISKLSGESSQLYGKIDDRHKKATDALGLIAAKQEEAEKLVLQCGEAYRVTTSIGLAGAFDQRAKRLSSSMWVWVGGLLVALTIGAYIGSHRVQVLSTAISDKEPQWGVIWMHVVLSLLSVGAPLWFAWLATKQIGQRFRLAEDYAFKASVAKAYEGYRREAARIDEAFEARLFSSALTRLEEAPLRLVESETHGSPWHELVSSEAFRKAIEAIPEFRDKFIEITKAGLSTLKAKAPIVDSKDEASKDT
jgi:hypothetical protein